MNPPALSQKDRLIEGGKLGLNNYKTTGWVNYTTSYIGEGIDLRDMVKQKNPNAGVNFFVWLADKIVNFFKKDK